MEIKLLDENTIQKIAAGEVIESPISIVKELVENSIDAESTSITVEIKKGGKELILVKDNGKGIDEDQIENAFLRHSTSKIDNFDDLYKINSLGFRGEALASIVAVARVKASSRTEDSTSGVEVYYENSKLLDKTKVGMNVGTSMEIRDLFHNIPVRRNFLESDITESNRITRLMYSLAIGNNDISFTYIKDNRQIFKTNGDGLENVLLSLYGKDYIDKSLKIENENHLYKIYGLISDNRFYRGNRSMQYIYVNDRLIDEDEIVKLIERQYSDLIPSSRFPAFQLFIETNPNNIDINIHPNKRKIKFKNIELLLDLIESTVTEKIYEQQKSYEYVEKEKDEAIDINDDDAYQRILDLYSQNTSTGSSGNFNLDFDFGSNQSYVNEDDKVDSDIAEFLSIDDDIEDKDIDYEDLENEEFNEYLKEDLEDQIKIEDSYEFNPDENFRRRFNYLGNIFDTYILFEDFDKSELILLDIQSSDERIVYEEIYDRYRREDIVSQRTIMPLTIDINEIEKNSYINKEELFKNLGFDIEFFGENQLIVRGFPNILENNLNEQALRDLLDLESGVENEEFIRELAKISNSRSFKKGNLPKEEGAYILLENLFNTSKPYQSPHGRPTMYSFSKREIDRKFLRK